MQITPTTFTAAAVVGAAAFAAGFVLRTAFAKSRLEQAEEKAKKALDDAKEQAERIKKEAELSGKDLLIKIKADFEKETKDRREELMTLEKRLLQREENLDRKADLMDRKDRDVARRESNIGVKEKGLTAKETELNNLLAQEKQNLQRVAHMSAEEAKKLLMSHMETEAKNEAAITVKKIADEAKEKGEAEARKLISLAIQRCAAEHTVETTVSVVNLPNDEMKGRIIGREGRNIRAIEIATGVDVIIDDTPGAVTLSGFDGVKREIARIALERLMSDGRIHPGRIEEIVEKVKKEMDKTIKDIGNEVLFEIGIHQVHPELVRLLGRLKYRTSYGQNVLQHSKEAAHLMGVMASELKQDFTLAKRIGLLHDIGKAVSHEVEGTHAKIGADLAKKFNESQAVVHAIEAHHQDIEANSILAVLVQAADAISATRPGARRETLEIYIKRLEKLESIADSFKGVEKAYAIQAGREVRVIVKPEMITDSEAMVLAKDITKKIEEGLEYPGQIKVTVIRETRAIEYAK